MKTLNEIKKANYLVLRTISELPSNEFGGQGHIYLPETKPMFVVFSNSYDWEHVSVSFTYRCPVWEEMCKVKDIFFNEEESVVQYHPPKSNYVNHHPYCLHLWKPLKEKIPLPPKHFV
jgi:hypothetical protein